MSWRWPADLCEHFGIDLEHTTITLGITESKANQASHQRVLKWLLCLLLKKSELAQKQKKITSVQEICPADLVMADVYFKE